MNKAKQLFASVNGMPPTSNHKAAMYQQNKMKSESNQLKASPSKLKTNAMPFYPQAIATNLKNSIGDSLFSDDYSTSSITGEYLHNSQINIGYQNGNLYFQNDKMIPLAASYTAPGMQNTI